MSKKIVSAILTIALIASMFTLVFVVPSSAASTGDIWDWGRQIDTAVKMSKFLGNAGVVTTKTTTEVTANGETKTTTSTEESDAIAANLNALLAKHAKTVELIQSAFAIYMFDEEQIADVSAYDLSGADTAVKEIAAEVEAIIAAEFTLMDELKVSSEINKSFLTIYAEVSKAKAEGKAYNEELYNKYFEAFNRGIQIEKNFNTLPYRAKNFEADYSGFENYEDIIAQRKELAEIAAFVLQFKAEEPGKNASENEIALMQKDYVNTIKEIFGIKEVVEVEKIVEVPVEKIVEKIVYKEVQTSDN